MGENTVEKIALDFPLKVCIGFPFRFHRIAVASLLPVSIDFPSGEKATE